MLAATDFKRGPTTWAWASGAVVALAGAVLAPNRFDLDFLATIVFLMFAFAAPNRRASTRQPRRELISLGFFVASFVLQARVAYAHWI